MTPIDQEFIALQSALLGRFSIERELGRGGMGIVYLARDVQLERSVAIKLLAPALYASADMRRRFLREARLAAQCFHPHIVPIHSVEEANGLAWIVMAYVRGETVAERVRRAGPLGAGQLTRLAQDVGWALSYAHQRGLVHRDVKPENILIDATTERFLIADFGIALSVHDELASTSGAAKAIGAGTPKYMAPEQFAGGAVDGRADLYALGGTLFFASTARAPFESNSSAGMAVKHASVPAPSARAFAPQLNVVLADAIDRCLSKLPGDRFATAEAFVEFVSPAEAQRVLPPSLIAVDANARGAKAMLGWAAAIGIATIGLSLGETAHSLGRDIIFGVGMSMSACLAVFGMVRGGEAILAARRAMKIGVGANDVVHALTGEVSSIPTSDISRRTSVLLMIAGVVLALSQGGLDHATLFPRVLHELLQVGLLFAPPYLIGRGAVGLTRGTRVRSWLHERIEKPVARFATALAARFIPQFRRDAMQGDVGGATEYRIANEVQLAFARLPIERQQLLGDMNVAAKALMHDAELLRLRDAELLANERAVRHGTEIVDQVEFLNTIREERESVQARLAITIAALETLRLDLLRAEMVTISGGLTTHVEAAREVGRQLDAAQELRAYLARSNPTPA